MTPKQTAILALSAVALSLLLQLGNAENIRLCGKRLSDLLTSICEQHGGFHAPRVRRNISPLSDRQRPVGDILFTLVRKQDPSVASSSSLSEMTGAPEGGVVDECCKKQCTLATLVSYCANARDIESINVDEILSGLNNMPVISETGLSQTSTNHGSANEQELYPGRYAHSRPNLGLSNRNRSVFIVLSQLQQEDEDKALGEYRF